MQRCAIFFLFLSLCQTGCGDEKFPVITFDLQGHSQVVSPYLSVIESIKKRPGKLDLESSKAMIAEEFPLPSPPSRGEFESNEEFQVRKNDYEKRRQQVQVKRVKKLKMLQKANLSKMQNAAKMSRQADALKDQTLKSLFFLYPTTAPRFDFDNKEYGPMPMPHTRFGMTDGGYIAHMATSFKPKGFVVSDIETAKKIRKVSDGGNLLAVVLLKNARVKIESGTEKVERSDLNQLGQHVTQGLPELIIRGLGEYFNPGINAQNPHPITKYDIKKSDNVPAFRVVISADSAVLQGLVDTKSKSTIWSAQDGDPVEYYDSGRAGTDVRIKKSDAPLTPRSKSSIQNNSGANHRVEFHESGQKKKEWYVKNGKHHGPFTVWYENGQKKSEGHYKDGERDGLSASWYENGKKESEGHFKDGELDGPFAGWYENGQKDYEGDYKNGELDGLYTAWHENGQKEYEANYKDGKQDGLGAEWDEDGQKTQEIKYKNGMLVSASVWKPDGKPCPITKVVDGSGILVEYHQNGQKEYGGNYKDGVKDGLWTRWHENGQKKSEAHYKNGELDGLWTEWDKDGNKVRESQYKDGVEVSYKEF